MLKAATSKDLKRLNDHVYPEICRKDKEAGFENNDFAKKWSSRAIKLLPGAFQTAFRATCCKTLPLAKALHDFRFL